MKKILAILIAILLIPTCVYAAAVTLSSVHYVAPGITMYKLASVADADTFAVKGPVGGYWYSWTDDQEETGLTGVSSAVSGSTTTFTFHTSQDGPTDRTCNFFVIE